MTGIRKPVSDTITARFRDRYYCVLYILFIDFPDWWVSQALCACVPALTRQASHWWSLDKVIISAHSNRSMEIHPLSTGQAREQLAGAEYRLAYNEIETSMNSKSSGVDTLLCTLRTRECAHGVFVGGQVIEHRHIMWKPQPQFRISFFMATSKSNMNSFMSSYNKTTKLHLVPSYDLFTPPTPQLMGTWPVGTNTRCNFIAHCQLQSFISRQPTVLGHLVFWLCQIL